MAGMGTTPVISDINWVAEDPAAFFAEKVKVTFHPVNAWLINDLSVECTPFKGFKYFAIFDQATVVGKRQTNLEGDAAVEINFIPHDAVLIPSLGGKTKTAGRSGKIVADISVPAAKSIQNTALVLNGISVQRFWNQQVGVD